MKSQTSNDLLNCALPQQSFAQSESRILAKKQALLQIYEFMDTYQKDMIGKLNHGFTFGASLQVRTSVPGDYANDGNVLDIELGPSNKQKRAKLHQIWLAMKPTYKPKTIFDH